MELDVQRQELERLGFKITAAEPQTLIAVRRKWHLDCIATRMTYVVFVRRVPRLDAELLERDRLELEERAKKLDSSVLPRGFQKGVAVITSYVADQVDESARQLCAAKPKKRFAWFYLPSALDLSSGESFYVRSTPMWGALYFAKFRFLIERMLRPSGTRSWPVSIAGSIFGLILLAIFLSNLAIIFGR